MTRADLKHCGKISEAREELNRSVREGRIESRHSIKSLEGMGSSSHVCHKYVFKRDLCDNSDRAHLTWNKVLQKKKQKKMSDHKWLPYYVQVNCLLASNTTGNLQPGSTMWSSHTTKSQDPIVATAIRMSIPGEDFRPTSGGFACNFPLPVAFFLLGDSKKAYVKVCWNGGVRKQKQQQREK